MSRNRKKKLVMGAAVFGAAVIASISLVACGSVTGAISSEVRQLSKDGVYSSYFNATDMMLALGYIPDVLTLDGDKTIFSDYQVPYLGEKNAYTNDNQIVETGKYRVVVGPDISRNQVNGEFIAGYGLKSILLNEWHKAASDANLTGAVPNLVYTTMADSANGRNVGDGISSVWGLHNWRMDLFKCFQFMLNSLKTIYPNKAASMQSRFDAFKAKTEERYQKVNDYMEALGSNSLKGKSIIFFDPERKPEDPSQPLPNKLRSDTLYEPFYSTDTKKGLGMVLPRPSALSSDETVNSARLAQLGLVSNAGEDTEFSIVGQDIAKLTALFKNSSDYVVVLKNPQVQHSAGYDEKAITAAASTQKTGDKEKVFVLNRDLWYDTMWGPIGINVLLDKIVAQFLPNSGIDLPAFDVVTPQDVFTNLR